MIAYLSGKIINKGAGFVIVLVNNIGYKVHVSSVMFTELDIGQLIDVYIYQHLKEDASNLYGFKDMEELEMFELLISISGIGPKSALGVLTVSSLNDLKETIAQGDSSLLIKVSGIGKKTAERVVLELREKVIKLSGGKYSKTGFSSSISGDEIDALVALGYSLSQARDALKNVDAKIKDSGERIKMALKTIG